jgi:hypothetical protein
MCGGGCAPPKGDRLLAGLRPGPGTSELLGQDQIIGIAQKHKGYLYGAAKPPPHIRRQSRLQDSCIKFGSDPRLSARIRGYFFERVQHFPNLFEMPLLVIAHERHCGNAVNLAEEWVLENDLPKAIVAVSFA